MNYSIDSLNRYQPDRALRRSMPDAAARYPTHACRLQPGFQLAYIMHSRT
jgi:hypothetical protein